MAEQYSVLGIFFQTFAQEAEIQIVRTEFSLLMNRTHSDNM